MNLRDQSFSVAQTNLAKKERLVKKAQTKLEKLEKQVEKAEEELEVAEREWEAAQFQVEIFKRKHNIEELFWRFPHIGEQILEEIDNRSVANCQQVNKWWCNFVHNGKSLLIRKIQRHVCISKEKFRKSLNKLSLEVLTKFEYHVGMHRKLADYRNNESFLQKNREPHTVEECRKQVFMRLIGTYPDQDPCIPIVCNLMLESMETKNPICRLFGSALHKVASDDNLPVFKLIFEKIENKHPKDTSYGGSENTPLHKAAKNGCSRVTRFILENSDADNINIPNRFGKTPLNLAEENNHKDICELLASANSKQNDIPRNPRKKMKRT